MKRNSITKGRLSSQLHVLCHIKFKVGCVLPPCLPASGLIWPARQWRVSAPEDDMRPVETLSSADLGCRVPGSAAESYQST